MNEEGGSGLQCSANKPISFPNSSAMAGFSTRSQPDPASPLQRACSISRQYSYFLFPVGAQPELSALGADDRQVSSGPEEQPVQATLTHPLAVSWPLVGLPTGPYIPL